MSIMTRKCNFCFFKKIVIHTIMEASTTAPLPRRAEDGQIQHVNLYPPANTLILPSVASTSDLRFGLLFLLLLSCFLLALLSFNK